MFLGHLPELFVVLVLALLVFGPKRMIEMGSSFGKAFREFRNATKEMSWSSLLNSSDDETPTTYSQMSQISQTYGAAKSDGAANGNITSDGTTSGVEPVTTATRV